MKEIDKEFGVSSMKLNDIIKRAEAIGSPIFGHFNSGYTIGIPTSIVMIIIITTLYFLKIKNRNNYNKNIKIHFRN